MGDSDIKGAWARIYLIHDFAFAASTWSMLPSLHNICREGEMSWREEEKRKISREKKKSSLDCSICGA